MITIEQLFGTLQQSVVATWRKHLRTAKYAKHIALNEFYEEMPELVDALIEAWMGANGRKIKGYENILQSSNMNTLTYLKELKKIVKQGYELVEDNEELESHLDDIMELINSTLYKVKELNEGRIDLADYINEALVNEGIKTGLQIPEDLEMPTPWDLVRIIDDIDGKLSNANEIDWEEYFDLDVFEQAENDIKHYFTNASMLFDAWTADLGNVEEGAFSWNEEVRDMASISGSGYALHKDGDDGTWSIFEFKKKPNSKEASFAEEFFNRYDPSWVIVEEF